MIYNIRTGGTMYKDQVLYTTRDRKLNQGKARQNEAKESGTESGIQGWHNKGKKDIKGIGRVTIYDKRSEVNWKQT